MKAIFFPEKSWFSDDAEISERSPATGTIRLSDSENPTPHISIIASLSSNRLVTSTLLSYMVYRVQSRLFIYSVTSPTHSVNEPLLLNLLVIPADSSFSSEKSSESAKKRRQSSAYLGFSS